jgi:hypothetical protein
MVTYLTAFLKSHLATMLTALLANYLVAILINPPGELPSNHSDSTSGELLDNNFLKPFF